MDAVNIRQSTADPVSMDTGNQKIQGRVVSKTIQYVMFTFNENAVWAGRQHLLKGSYPFAVLQMRLNRKAFKIDVGECFKFSYPKHGVYNAVFRVLQKEETELESEDITIYSIEDFYAVARGISEYSIPGTYIWQFPDYTLYPFTKQLIIEVPYVMTNNSDIEILPGVCREGVHDAGFDCYISIDNGVSYSLLSNNIGNLLPFGELVDAEYPKTYMIDIDVGFNVLFKNQVDADLVETTSWANTIAGIANIALIGDEIIYFKTITPVSGLTYNIKDIIRARMDTVKAVHPIGANFWVLSSDLTFLSHSEIVVGVNRDFKFVPYNIRLRGDISVAVPYDFDIIGRVRTPYIPGNFMANGSGFAGRYDSDIVLTWSPRFRGKGAGVGVPGVVLAETDREGLFKIEVWVSGVLVRTIVAIDAVTWTYTSAMNITDNGSLANFVLFKLSNYRSESGIVYSSVQTEVMCKKN